MAGAKGRSGTNKGKDRPWSDALRLASMEQGADGFKKLRAIAEKCVQAAMDGDMQAIKEIGDRLDGKAVQSVDLTAETTVRYVARVPDKKANATEWQEQHSPATMMQ